MPSSDYASAIGGGLKLKGVSSGGIEKKKKKSKKNKDHSNAKDENKVDPNTSSAATKDRSLSPPPTDKPSTTTITPSAQDAPSKREVLPSAASTTAAYKTVAQRKHDEQRRKRLDERLRREGVQTHKERVEQLNKYLSGLSEHHDMPRIGPG